MSYRRILILFMLGILLTLSIAPVRANNQNLQPLTNSLELVEQGKQHYDLGQFRQTVEDLQQAAQAFAAQGDQLKLAIILSNLSLAYQQLGEWDNAYQAIADSFNKLGVNPQENIPNLSPQHLNIIAPALNIYGRLWYLRGKPAMALDSWQKATEIYQRLNYQTGAISSQINQVQALQVLGLYQQAQIILAQIEQSLEQVSPSLQAQGWRSLGEVLKAMGDFKTSQEVLEKSLAIARKIPSKEQESATLLSLGNTLWALGNLVEERQDTRSTYDLIPWQCEPHSLSKEALVYYERAAQTYQQATKAFVSSPLAIKAQINHLHLLIKTGQLQNVQTALQDINLSNLLPSRTAVYAKINLAQNLACLHQQLPSSSMPTWEEIDQLLEQTIQEAKNLEDSDALSYGLGNRGSLYEYLSKQNPQNLQKLKIAQQLTEQALLQAQPSVAPHVAYQWQWQLGRIFARQGEREKAISMYQDAVETLNKVREDIITIDTEVQFSFRDNVEPLYRQLVSLLLTSKETVTPSQIQLASAINLIDSLQLAELENFLRCNLNTVAKDERVIDEIEPTAFIYPILLEEGLGVIYNLPQQPLLYQINFVNKTEVNNTIQALRKAISRRNPEQVKKISQKIYQWLIQPLETYLDASSKVETLVFILDGYLRNIPMAVLYDSKKQEYLVEKDYALALLPTSRLFVPRSSSRKMRVLAGGISEKIEVENRQFLSINVEEELKQIKSLTSTQTLLNSQFTQANLQQQLQEENFSVVHMATHGNFSSDPQQTYILAYGQLLRPNDLNTLLQQGGVGTNSVDLLVLSACQTASGDNRAALGLAGLAVRAGAQSTLATLWRVSDKFTIRLITKFYQQLSQGATKAQALHQAQKSLLYEEIGGQRYQNDPYDWSPYVLVGNWE